MGVGVEDLTINPYIFWEGWTRLVLGPTSIQSNKPRLRDWWLVSRDPLCWQSKSQVESALNSEPVNSELHLSEFTSKAWLPPSPLLEVWTPSFSKSHQRDFCFANSDRVIRKCLRVPVAVFRGGGMGNSRRVNLVVRLRSLAIIRFLFVLGAREGFVLSSYSISTTPASISICYFSSNQSNPSQGRKSMLFILQS